MIKYLKTAIVLPAFLIGYAHANAVIYDANDFLWETSNYNPSATVSGDVYALTIDLNDLSAYGSSYDSSQNDQESSFEGQFDFSNYGQSITGFEYTIYGQYGIETPGDIYVSVNGNSVLSSSTSAFNEDFVLSGTISSSEVLDLNLLVSASSYEDIIEVITGYEEVYVGEELVLQNPGCDDVFDQCIYIEEAIYESVPIYMYQSDLGEASVSVSKIVITPQEVPLPAGVWLFASSLVALSVRKLKK